MDQLVKDKIDSEIKSEKPKKVLLRFSLRLGFFHFSRLIFQMKLINDYLIERPINWDRLNPQRFSITGEVCQDLKHI